MSSGSILVAVIFIYSYFALCKFLSGRFLLIAGEAAKKAIADSETSDQDLSTIPWLYRESGGVTFPLLVILVMPFAVWSMSLSGKKQKNSHSESYTEFQNATFFYALVSNPLMTSFAMIWGGLWFGLAYAWRYLLIALALSASPSYAMDIPSAMARVISMPQQMISRICHR